MQDDNLIAAQALFETYFDCGERSLYIVRIVLVAELCLLSQLQPSTRESKSHSCPQPRVSSSSQALLLTAAVMLMGTPLVKCRPGWLCALSIEKAAVVARLMLAVGIIDDSGAYRQELIRSQLLGVSSCLCLAQPNRCTLLHWYSRLPSCLQRADTAAV